MNRLGFIIVLIVLSVSMYREYYPSPKFKVGDCTMFSPDTEFPEAYTNRDIKTILKVGKNNYLYRYYYSDNLYEQKIRLYHIGERLVPCPTEE